MLSPGSSWFNNVITALTGYGQAENLRRSREAGFNHHMTKPPDPELLAALLESPQTFSDGR